MELSDIDISATTAHSIIDEPFEIETAVHSRIMKCNSASDQFLRAFKDKFKNYDLTGVKNCFNIRQMKIIKKLNTFCSRPEVQKRLNQCVSYKELFAIMLTSLTVNDVQTFNSTRAVFDALGAVIRITPITQHHDHKQVLTAVFPGITFAKHRPQLSGTTIQVKIEPIENKLDNEQQSNIDEKDVTGINIQFGDLYEQTYGHRGDQDSDQDISADHEPKKHVYLLHW
jgi:hypothetical protein